ncbi:MAG: hypothetical protein WCP96_06965 [Methylococcaceae bacterium]
MNINLTKSIRQILLVCSTATFAASTLATVGIQNPPPGPGDIPDYFGVTGNYANSPQPVLTEVAIIDNGKGGGATATAATNPDGSIKSISVGAAGAGYISPQVTITDSATGGNGAQVSAVVGITTNTTTSTNPNGIITGITVCGTCGGSGYSAATIVNITDAAVPSANAFANVTVDANGVITGVNVSNGGSGYVSPQISFNDPATGGTGATAGVAVDTTNGGIITGLTVDNTNTLGQYSAQTTVLITDADLAITPATVATADVIVDANGLITGFKVTSPGSGYVTPVATITDPNYHASGSGATASAVVGTTTTTTSTTAPDGVITAFTIPNGGSNYSSGATVQITDTTTPGGSGASANVIVDATGTITGFTNIVGGTGYVSPSVAIVDSPLGSGFNATVTTDTTGLTTGTLGAVTGFTITGAGSGYRSPTVSITDLSNLPGGTGAIAAATTYDYAATTPGAYTSGIQDVQVLHGGNNYTAATQVIVKGFSIDPKTNLPNYTAANVVPNIVNGVITPDATHPGGFTIVHTGKGYDVPKPHVGLKKFVDLLPGIPGVSSYTSAAGYTNGTTNLGQALPLAVPDTTTFPGSDYYVIAENAYTQQMHSDLPATHLRGYIQLNYGTDGAGNNTVAPPTRNQYLGPIIVAQKERPVRIKLVNQLPIGDPGKLPFPVDHTYMGASGKDAKTGNLLDTDNRTAMHLHGGNTPWISDGTPRQWIKPAGEVGNKRGVSATDVPDMWYDASGNLINDPANCKQGTTTCTTAGATNYPGDAALTFYYTNDQSARLMFYHDHAEGITRLNVYDGMAAGYLLQDPTEQDLVNGTNNSGNNLAGYKVLPPLEDTIPLVFQEKTFVPDNTAPVLNFYGPFASQLNSSDPTWRWTSGAVAPGPNGNGDLWVPHVFMPNQNPGDISGANNFGRWDYGPWFWPPFTGITHGPVVNPYYDAKCISTTTNYCEGQYIPGVPNGNTLTGAQLTALNYDPALLTLGEPTGTPEAFNDTPLVNGTVYPVLKVDPKPYRLRMLSVGNDRMLNLSLVVAASNTGPVTADQNAAPAPNTSVLCDGTTTVDRSLCTEAKMVPFNAAQHKVSKFPDWWYSPQKGGVTFDGRPSGVFDPATRGPAMVQIGTDGGFLSTPVVIKNQPVNFEYNLKNIVVTNVKEHALLLGPAERADVVVDFSNFAGSTLLMYNDAPAPMPAFDLRLDYFTGDYDNTDTGGAFSTLPGYGPNTRTLMQIQVSGSGGSHPVDDYNKTTFAALTTAVQTAFRTSQEPIIIPQAAYNATYNSAVNDSTLAGNTNHNLALIQDYSLNFTPYASPATSGAVNGTVLMDMQPKTIIEDWTMDYGRMNALLGVELPRTTATTNTALPLGYTDPPTELVKISPNDGSAVGSTPLTDGTQLWRITHNGVDSHAIHFHLFHVQIVNRVGWDGMIRPTEPNELGWKDTVRMNPLEDVVVALRPKQMLNLPFKVPNSHRLMDTNQAANGGQNFFNLDPQTGNASTVNNQNINYGWEYVWHCHILGHEENDMMRSIAVAQTPDAPTIGLATGTGTSVTVNWTDNSIISNWVTIQRALDSGFTTGLTPFNVKVDECTVQAGCARSYVDNAVPVGTSVYYRVMANNTVGGGDVNGALPTTLVNTLTPGFAGYDNVTAESTWSGSVSRVVTPIAGVNNASLTFAGQLVNTTSAAQLVTVSNTGTGNLTFPTTASVSANYAVSANTCTTVAPGASCTISVTFTPTTTTGSFPGTLTIPTNDSATGHNPLTVSLTGSVAVLNAATGLTAHATSSTQVALSFTNTSNGETGYQVLAQLPPVAPGTLGVIKGTAAQKTLTFTLPTNKGSGYATAPSVTITGLNANVTCPAPIVTLVNGSVSAVSTVTCSNTGTNGNWNNPTLGATFTGGTSTAMTVLPAANVNLTPASPAQNAPATAVVTMPGTLTAYNYSFQVAPLFNATVGAVSNTATLDLTAAPLAPANFAATQGTAGTLNLSWTPVANAVTYNLQARTNTAGTLSAWSASTVIAGNVGNYVFTGTSGKIYQFQINVVNPKGTSAYATYPLSGGSGAVLGGAVIGGGQVIGMSGALGGTGYLIAPTVSISGGTQVKTNAALGTVPAPSATYAVASGTVIPVTTAGNGYSVAPLVTVSAPNAATATVVGTNITATATWQTAGAKTVTLTAANQGSGYAAAVTPAQVTVTWGNRTGTVTAVTMGTGTTAGKVISIAITMPAGATNAASRPTAITIAAPAKTQAVATATVANNVVTGVTITTAGAGYVTAPIVSIGAANVTSVAATATATVAGGAVTGFTGLPSGTNYTTAPNVSLTPVLGIAAP